MSEAGHYNDQIGAMFAAVIPQIDVQGLDTDSDQNRFNVPYYLLFKDEMTDTFGALWGNDELKVRPTAFKRTNDRGEVTDDLGLFWRVYVNGSDIFANTRLFPFISRNTFTIDVPEAKLTVATGLDFQMLPYTLEIGRAHV